MLGRNVTVTALIMAAGNSTRMKSTISKQLLTINEKPLIAHTLTAFENSRYITDIIIVTREQDILAMKDIADLFGLKKVKKVVCGGAVRQESVKRGLNEVCDGDYIAVHDGARPCITTEQIDKTIETAFRHQCAAIGCHVTDTLKLVKKEKIIKTIDRENLWQIQTPQVFSADIIRQAYKKADENGICATDDTALLEQLNIPVVMVEGDSLNIKVTTPHDAELAEMIIRHRRGQI